MGNKAVTAPLLSPEEEEALRKAGRIASEVRTLASRMAKEGMRIIDLCERVEGEIKARGGLPAFPCNVDINEVGAHYTSPPDDPALIPEGSIVKIDLGVHVNGYIADTAATVSFNPELSILKQAAEEALEAALKVMRPGVKASAVGGVIQGIIEKYGCKPVQNLTGHTITRYNLHAGKVIPNVAFIEGGKVEAGEVYAIEPFATTKAGAGQVENGRESFIYRVLKDKPPKEEEKRRVMEAIRSNFTILPFAWRWVPRVAPTANLHAIFKELVYEHYLYGYPVLIEGRNQPVGQAEHTLIVLEDGCEVTTL